MASAARDGIRKQEDEGAAGAALRSPWAARKSGVLYAARVSQEAADLAPWLFKKQTNLWMKKVQMTAPLTGWLSV